MNSDILKNFAQKAKRRLVGREKVTPAKIKVITNDDVDFRLKVENLLAQEKVVTNPIHYLMDEKVLKNLEGNARERYLFSTIDKYNSLKSELQNLQSATSCCL